MSAFRRAINGCSLAMMAGVLSGCLVTVVGEYETYAGTATDRFSSSVDGALPAYEKHPTSPTKAFVFGANHIVFQPPWRSDNVQAAGPLIPIIPVPGEGSDFGENQFFILIEITPGPASFLILNPAEYLLTVEGSDTPLAPFQMKDCDSNDVELSQLRFYGSRQCRGLYYDITIGEVTRFTFTPATIEADERFYIFPDIEYQTDTYGYVQ